MNIISSPTSSSMPPVSRTAKLLSSHPASQLFEFTVKHSSINAVTMTFQARECMPLDSGSIRGALGCVIDCAARIAAQSSIGTCTLLEQELHYRAQDMSTRFEVTARIDSAMARYAVYHCAIYALEQQERRLIAESQGTLLQAAPLNAHVEKGPTIRLTANMTNNPA